MTVLRNLVITIGLVAVWLVAVFFLFLWPAFQAFSVSFGESYLASIDSRLASFLWIAVPYALGGFIVGFLVTILVKSDRPSIWALMAGLGMSTVLLFNVVDDWFLSQPLKLQVAEFFVALLPLAFCGLSAIVGGRFNEPRPV